VVLTACIYEGFWVVEYIPISALSLKVRKRVRSRDLHNTYVLPLVSLALKLLRGTRKYQREELGKRLGHLLAGIIIKLLS
jgi:hypothetical protein